MQSPPSNHSSIHLAIWFRLNWICIHRGHSSIPLIIIDWAHLFGSDLIWIWLYRWCYIDIILNLGLHNIAGLCWASSYTWLRDESVVEDTLRDLWGKCRLQTRVVGHKRTRSDHRGEPDLGRGQHHPGPIHEPNDRRARYLWRRIPGQLLNPDGCRWESVSVRYEHTRQQLLP